MVAAQRALSMLVSKRTWMERLYAQEVSSLQLLDGHLDREDCEWPTREVAREAVSLSVSVLDLNHKLRRHRGACRSALIRDESWIRLARARAQRMLRGSDGDDGQAGVREPRRPLPDPPGLVARADPTSTAS